MRVSVGGVEPSGRRVRFTFDGDPVEAEAGDTVASALIDASKRRLREAGPDERRGVFCGMGVCAECTVTIDGQPGKLACLEPVRVGIRVEPQPAISPMPSAENRSLPEQSLEPDLLVVGGGPAGLSAAITSAEAGLTVVLVDERTKLGGQYFKQPPPSSRIDPGELDDQYAEGRDLILAAEAAGVQILLGTRIWAATSPKHFHAAGVDVRWTIRPRSVVLATGAYERGVPVPGWTLPGVMTTGAAQSLLRANQVSPGSRVLVAGNGPLNLQLAAEMSRAGVKVVALAETADVRWWTGLGPGARMLFTSPKIVRRGIGYRTSLAKARVPVMSRTSLVAAGGADVVETATLARIDSRGYAVTGTERTFEVDAVCMGYGFMPSNEIPRALDCSHEYDSAAGYLRTTRSDRGRTSVDGVWVVGDAAGVYGAQVAMAMGTLAAIDAIDHLGGNMASVSPTTVAKADRSRQRNLRFQKYLSRMYSSPVLTNQLATAETVVCRCESVRMEEIEVELAAGANTAGAVKRVTRAGMGKCQGRYCAPVIASLIAETSGQPIGEYSGFAPQPPFRPMEISAIADPEDRT